MLNHAKVEPQIENQADGSWIDFRLAFGLPSLFILLLTFALTIYDRLIRGNQLELTGVWLILGFMFFGLIAEINHKQNCEILFFYILCIGFDCTHAKCKS